MINFRGTRWTEPGFLAPRPTHRRPIIWSLARTWRNMNGYSSHTYYDIDQLHSRRCDRLPVQATRRASPATGGGACDPNLGADSWPRRRPLGHAQGGPRSDIKDGDLGATELIPGHLS